MIVAGVAKIGLGIHASSPRQPCQDIRCPRGCRWHETAERNLRPMGGVELAASECQRVRAGRHGQGAR
jgi:hypothetical protein